MAARFVEVTRVDIGLLMDECGFKPVHIQGTAEAVFQRFVDSTRLAVRVYSTVPEREEMARACGEDAMRVLVVDTDTGKILWSATRTHRTQGWRDRLKERMRAAWSAAKQIPGCPECGKPMVQRKAKATGRGFWGCVAYPACSGTKYLARAS